MRRNREGWVLIETLVAMVLLSVGVMAINRAMRESIKTRALAEDYTTARFLLEEKMSELEMQPVLLEGAASAGGYEKAHQRFKFAWTVTRVDFPVPPIPADLQQAGVQPPQLPEPYLGKISVTIQWKRAERNYDATAETLVSSEKLFTKEQQNATTQPKA